MSEEQIDESKVSQEAIDEHYSSLNDEDKKTFDALDDDAKSAKQKEVGDKAIDVAKENALKQKGDTVPLATFLEQKKAMKVLEDKITGIEKDAKTKSDEEMKKKGEFETLATQKTEELKTATDQISELETTLKVYTDATDAKIESFLSTVKEEDKEIVNAVLGNKTTAEKEAVLPNLLKRFGSPDDINASAGGNADTKKKTALELEDAKTKLEEAKKGGDAMGVLKYQKIIKELEEKGK